MMGVVTLRGLLHLTGFPHLHVSKPLIWSRLHDRWGSAPHVTSPILGPPPPSKQALKGHFYITVKVIAVSSVGTFAVYVLVQFCPWFNFYFLLRQTRYHTLPYPPPPPKNELNQEYNWIKSMLGVLRFPKFSCLAKQFDIGRKNGNIL